MDADLASTAGAVEFTTAFRGQPETHRTWYKIVGPPATQDRTPLLVLRRHDAS